MFYLLFACLIFISVSHCDTGGVSNDVLYYKEHQIRTEQLCPDLQESAAGGDIDTANYPYKSVFKLADQVWRTADPCVFEARGPRNQFTIVVIKAIQADNQPWDYSGAQPCLEHIKLRIPSRRIFSRMGLPLCTVPKPPNPEKLFQGPYYNPHVWQFSRQKMGLSFAIYANESVGSKDDEDGGIEANEITQPNGFLLNNAKLPKFVQIVFASVNGESCSIRVQQYIVDSKKKCNASISRTYPLCGTYTCNEEERVMRQAQFWDDGMHLSEKYKLIDFLRTKQFRHPNETSIVDFFINLMRLMVMPMVFFVAYYVTRQLREKLANRQIQLPAQSASNINLNIHRGTTSGSRVGIGPLMAMDSPTSSRRTRFEDPPPSYDTIITPPTYMEATTQKIEIISPSSNSNVATSDNQIQIESEASSDAIITVPDISISVEQNNLLSTDLAASENHTTTGERSAIEHGPMAEDIIPKPE